MYSSPSQVNQLVSLLRAHGVTDVVVCPGSRNATIVHDLHEAADAFCLHPVTDERSAAFVALGMALATQQAAAVCVTSGSALLGCVPAVAEAYYRRIPLLVISADRPSEWIGQGDGQTLPQVGALQPYATTFALRIPHNETDRWANNRLTNEALLTLGKNGGTPVHINVPIAEPMFGFDTESLPTERIIHRYEPQAERPLPASVCELLAGAKMPMLLVGHYERGDLRKEVEDLEANGQLLVMPEVISDVPGSLRMPVWDAIHWPPNEPKAWLDQDEVTEYLPDVVVHVGGNFVHKRFKQLLRRLDCKVVRIGRENEMPDTFCHLDTQVVCDERAALAQLVEVLPRKKKEVVRAQQYFDGQVQKRMQAIEDFNQRQFDPKAKLNNARPTLAETLSLLYYSLNQQAASYTLHLGNSSAVRAAARIFPSGTQPILCNRGTNGIEGSVSTAVGYALKLWGLHIVVVGDLSFFYDANALWNTQLPDNLRIVVLNNNHGAIFDHLPGLEKSPARDRYIAAGGQTFLARGISDAYHLDYQSASTVSELTRLLPTWLQEGERAKLLEVML